MQLLPHVIRYYSSVSSPQTCGNRLFRLRKNIKDSKEKKKKENNKKKKKDNDKGEEERKKEIIKPSAATIGLRGVKMNEGKGE